MCGVGAVPLNPKADRRHRIATILFGAIGVFFLLDAASCLLIPIFPPQFQNYLGHDHLDMDEKSAGLIFILLRLIGVLYLAIGASIVSLVIAYRRQPSHFIRRTIALAALPFGLVILVTAPFGLVSPNGIAPAVVVAVTLVAFWFANQAEKMSKKYSLHEAKCGAPFP